MSDHETIWQETASGGLLHGLFGFFPTLHDAQILSITYDRANESLEMQVDYSDLVDGGDRDLTVRMRLRWSSVRSLDVELRHPEIFGIRFERRDDDIATIFEPGYALSGTVVSQGFEAVLEKVGPEPIDSDSVRIRFV